MSFSAIDVYGFAGGFTLGMAQAGFQIVGKREFPNGFGIANCEVNRHLLPGGWKAQAAPAAQWEVVADSTVVFGNPPCS
jgi:site-specific DNA-cytosine methylase